VDQDGLEVPQIEEHILADHGSTPGMESPDRAEALSSMTPQQLQNLGLGRRSEERLRPPRLIGAEVLDCRNGHGLDLLSWTIFAARVRGDAALTHPAEARS
jgi:hypothetical protein